MTTPISGHATLIARQPAATPGVFTTIAELGDFTLPELSRNEFDASVHNRNIDSYVLGMLRRGAMTFPMNFIPAEPTQDHLTGLYSAIIANSIDGYKVTFPDNTLWIMSGQVQAIKSTAPVDGKLSAEVTLRFSGFMSIGGVLIGT